MERRIESKTSRTAEYTCLVRCLSNLENRTPYRTDDYISSVIMNGFVRQLLRIAALRRHFQKKNPPGMYEYVIARTKYIDAVFRQALEGGVEQVLIFGAGFDSRAVRFSGGGHGTRIFELDAPATQAAKMRRYQQKRINVPANLVFIPIDFDRQSLPERLEQSGFQSGRSTLFVLEGLTMYLQPSSVESTFRIIAEMAGAGSQLVFDHVYASVVRQENLYEGERELYDSVAGSGERFCFGIERGCAREFLSGHGFTPTAILDADALEKMYFRDERGLPIARVNQTHCIVSAVKG